MGFGLGTGGPGHPVRGQFCQPRGFWVPPFPADPHSRLGPLSEGCVCARVFLGLFCDAGGDTPLLATPAGLLEVRIEPSYQEGVFSSTRLCFSRRVIGMHSVSLLHRNFEKEFVKFPKKNVFEVSFEITLNF